MGFTIVAVGVGLLVGVALGGRPRHLSERSFRFVPLLAGGLLLQLGGLGGAGGQPVLVSSYLALLVFTLANLRHVGLGVVAVGLVLNLAPIAVNRGMPVRATAIVAAGLARTDELATLQDTQKRHLERPGDHLEVLGDIIPVRLLHEVLSFGDLVLSVGVADVLVHLLAAPRRRRRPQLPLSP